LPGDASGKYVMVPWTDPAAFGAVPEMCLKCDIYFKSSPITKHEIVDTKTKTFTINIEDCSSYI
jgi:hypothetical protein